MRKNILILLLVALLLINLFPVNFYNPPSNFEIETSQEVKSLLKESCYDCHSNLTNYPWYSKIAPISYLIKHDIEEGRSELNFSYWNNYSEAEKNLLSRKIVEVIEEDEMPEYLYLLLHSKARLDSNEKRMLLDEFSER